MTPKTKVVVIDDQNIARHYFELHIKSSPSYDVVFSTPRAEAAISYCDNHPADLVLMDIVLKFGMDGLTAAGIIKQRHPNIRVIVTTSMAEVSWPSMARELGLESFWFKEYGDEPLLSVMDRTMAGESVYPAEIPVLQLGFARRTDFTDRELDVLREITTGATNEEIAQRLNISANTVKSHVQHLMEKTGYTSRTGLAVDARIVGMVVDTTHMPKENY